MSREKELAKNTFILSVGKLLPKLCSFITLPILTAYLTKSEYGTFDLIATLVMLIIPIATLQIQSAAFRFLIDCRNNQEGTSEIISSILIVTIPVSIIASIVIQFFFRDMSIWVKIFTALYFFLDTIYLTVGQITRGLGFNKHFSIGAILLWGVNMVGIVLFVAVFRYGLAGVMASLAFAQLAGIAFMAYKINISKYIHISSISLAKLKELIAYSWPMIPNNLSSWVLKLSDRLVITAVLGVEANAVYAVANKIPNLLSIGQSILVMAWQENASIAAGDEDASEYYSKIQSNTFNLMFGFTALLIAATPLIFRILIKGDYGQAYYQMPILIMAMFFFVMSAYFGGIYIAHKRTVNVGVTTMIAAVINLVIDLIFVRIIGIWAGSISTLTAYAFLYFYRMINCQTFQKMKIKYMQQFAMMGILVVMLVLCFQKNIVLDVVNCFAGVVLFIVFNMDVLKGFLGKTRKRKRK